ACSTCSGSSRAWSGAGARSRTSGPAIPGASGAEDRERAAIAAARPHPGVGEIGVEIGRGQTLRLAAIGVPLLEQSTPSLRQARGLELDPGDPPAQPLDIGARHADRISLEPAAKGAQRQDRMPAPVPDRAIGGSQAGGFEPDAAARLPAAE